MRQRIEQEVGPMRKELLPEVEQAREPSRQEEQEEQPVQLVSTKGPQGVQRLQLGLFRTLLHQTRDLVEQQGAQWLHTFFSESVRTTLQQQTEQKLRLSLQTGLEAILGDSARHELQQEAEQTLQPLLQEAFDAIFVGPVRADMQWHGERVIQALLYGDFEAAGQHAEQAFQSSLHATLAVLQHHLEKIVPLLLKVFLKAVQQALGSRLKENLGTIVTAPFGRVEETGAASQECMAGAQETMQQGVEKVHRRLRAVRANSAQDDQGTSVTYL
jgi:hypothetical protein